MQMMPASYRWEHHFGLMMMLGAFMCSRQQDTAGSIAHLP